MSLKTIIKDRASRLGPHSEISLYERGWHYITIPTHGLKIIHLGPRGRAGAEGRGSRGGQASHKYTPRGRKWFIIWCGAYIPIEGMTAFLIRQTLSFEWTKNVTHRVESCKYIVYWRRWAFNHFTEVYFMFKESCIDCINICFPLGLNKSIKKKNIWNFRALSMCRFSRNRFLIAFKLTNSAFILI